MWSEDAIKVVENKEINKNLEQMHKVEKINVDLLQLL